MKVLSMLTFLHIQTPTHALTHTYTQWRMFACTCMMLCEMRHTNEHRHLSVLKLASLPAAAQTSTVYLNTLSHTHIHTHSALGWHRESKQGRWVRNDGWSLVEQVSTPRCLSFTHPTLSAQSQPVTHTLHTQLINHICTHHALPLYDAELVKLEKGYFRFVTWTT